LIPVAAPNVMHATGISMNAIRQLEVSVDASRRVKPGVGLLTLGKFRKAIEKSM